MVKEDQHPAPTFSRHAAILGFIAYLVVALIVLFVFL